MDQIKFSTRTLGQKAAERLRNVKGRFVTFRAKAPASREVLVYLDGEELGKAELKAPPKLVSLSISKNPAICATCGFDTPEELQSHLRRSGFSRKPLEELQAYMIQLWASWGTKTFLSWSRKPAPPPKSESAPVTIEVPAATGDEETRRLRAALEIQLKQLQEREGRLKAEESALKRERKALAEERKALDGYRDRLEELRSRLEDELDEEKAAELMDGLRKRIADEIEAPSRRPTTEEDIRLWKLRVAGQILSLLGPYLKPPLTQVDRSWLHVERPD